MEEHVDEGFLSDVILFEAVRTRSEFEKLKMEFQNFPVSSKRVILTERDIQDGVTPKITQIMLLASLASVLCYLERDIEAEIVYKHALYRTEVENTPGFYRHVLLDGLALLYFCRKDEANAKNYAEQAKAVLKQSVSPEQYNLDESTKAVFESAFPAINSNDQKSFEERKIEHIERLEKTRDILLKLISDPSSERKEHLESLLVKVEKLLLEE